MRHTLPLLTLMAAGWLSLSPAGAAAGSPAALSTLPRLVLWSWERPTNLRGLDAGTGVAFLAQTITIGGTGVRIEPRRQPLYVLSSTALVAVTRLEHEPVDGLLPDDAGRRTIVDAIADAATWPQVAATQIDYDAAVSERAFYAQLLVDLRQRLGSRMPLSITALASWCAGDRWLQGLPVDEVVPMLFRMGPTNEPYASIAMSTDAAASACRDAVGVSLDEPLPLRPAGRRVYVFNPAPWTNGTVIQAREVLR